MNQTLLQNKPGVVVKQQVKTLHETVVNLAESSQKSNHVELIDASNVLRF